MILAIDLGTTNSVCAIFIDGKSKLFHGVITKTQALKRYGDFEY